MIFSVFLVLDKNFVVTGPIDKTIAFIQFKIANSDNASKTIIKNVVTDKLRTYTKKIYYFHQ